MKGLQELLFRSISESRSWLRIPAFPPSGKQQRNISPSEHPQLSEPETIAFSELSKAKQTDYDAADQTGQKADSLSRKENLVRAPYLQRTLCFRSSLPCCHRPSWVLHSGWTPGKSPLGRCCFYHWPLAPHTPFLLLPQSCHWKPAKDERWNTLMQSCSNQNTFRFPWLSLHPQEVSI